MRSARATDAHKIKAITGALLTTPEHLIGLSHDTRADWGFNNDNTGRMLIPVQYFEEYNTDPVRCVHNTFLLHLLIAMHSMRVLLNAGDPAYIMTAKNTPAFLYEDATKYNPDDVFAGLM
jgi:hypothetical protein